MSAGPASLLASGWSALVAPGELYLTYNFFFCYTLNRFPSLVFGGEHVA